MRKDEPSEEDVRVQELTTADLAQSKRPSVSEDRLKQDRPKEDRLKEDPLRPALADPLPGEAVQNNVSGTPSTTSSAISAGSSASDTTPLFPNSELEALRTRWSEVQTDFVDEPRRAVEQADSLVASAMKRLAEVFAEERSKLEGQWDRGDNISTEDLRIALQRYRSFFHRLLSI
jgi:hypothetical protein